MIDYLFLILDIPLTFILIVLALFDLLFIKNIYNIFINLFVAIFFTIFTASTILTEQIYLGEFLVINIFFILAVIFFLFNLSDDFTEFYITKQKKSKSKKTIISLALISVFCVIGLNFYKINTNNINIKARNILIEDTKNISLDNQDIAYDSYIENLSLLNQNKLFQKLTHIIMFYICLVIILYYFNRRGLDER